MVGYFIDFIKTKYFELHTDGGAGGGLSEEEERRERREEGGDSPSFFRALMA